MSLLLEIPNLAPEHFDNHFFGKWKAPVFDIYKKFHITPIQQYKDHMKLPILPHRREVYFFVFVTKGLMVRSKNLAQYELKENDFYCLPAFQISSMEWISDDIEGFYCHFHPEIFNQRQLSVEIERDFPFFDITAEPIVKVRDPNRINSLLELLNQEYTKNEVGRADILSLYLTTLLSEVRTSFSMLKQKKLGVALQISKRYKVLLSERIYDIKYVSDAANLLEISPNHLNKCTKEITGKSAHDLLVDMRVLHAKVLLKQTDLQIQEIAFKLGEFESSDFIRFFRKQTNMTPIEYRNLSN